MFLFLYKNIWLVVNTHLKCNTEALLMDIHNVCFVKKWVKYQYHIQPYYHTYPYKHTVKLFRSFQITASVLFVYFFIKAYFVGTHLNYIDLSM